MTVAEQAVNDWFWQHKKQLEKQEKYDEALFYHMAMTKYQTAYFEVYGVLTEMPQLLGMVGHINWDVWNANL